MKKVYEEIISYFGNASEKDILEDLAFLDKQDNTEILVSDYLKQLEENLTNRLTISKKSIECISNNENYNYNEKLYLAA